MKGNQTSIAEVPRSGLSRRQETAISALLSQPTIKEAATIAKIGESTIWRWLQNEEFHAAYMQARRESVKQSIARLQSYTSAAVDTLHEVMTDKSAKDFARVAAAKAILDYSLKAVEIEDLATRLAELETVMAAHQEEESRKKK